MVERIAERVVEKIKERLMASFSATWELFLESLNDFAYVAALYGGAGCIIARVIGYKQATKHFIALQVIFTFVKAMLA